VLFLALAVGLGELTLRLVARLLRPEPVFLHPAAIWLGPASALLVLTPLVALAWCLGRVRNASAAWGAAVGVGAFLATLDVLMLVPRLHLLGLALLAAGVAAQVVWTARRWPAVFDRVTRVGTLALATIVVAGGAWSARTLTGSFGSSSQVPAREGAPSVLLLVLDTVRALELSAYGFARPTSPRLAALAREGVRFERAVATAPWTLPTHASLFTGRFQRDLSVGWSSPLDGASPTIAEHFGSLGYATGGFIANLRYCSREYGLGRGFQVYRDYSIGASQVVGSTMLGRRALGLYNDALGRYVLVGRKDAGRVVDEFLSWQGGLSSRPFFGFLNFFDAHEPYAPEAPYDLMFAGREPPTRQLDVGRRHSAEELQGLRDAYDGAIASLDEQIGRLLDTLRERGVLEQTIIVVTADHGEEFAEHGHVSHGNGLHFPALHVPLLIRWPQGGVPAMTQVETPVSLADVPATIVELATGAAASPLAGSSLAPLWRGEAAPGRSPILSELYWVPNQPEWYPVSGGNMRSLVRGRYHYIAGPNGREELYDVAGDPFEARDLVADPALSDTLASLRRALTAFPAADRGGR